MKRKFTTQNVNY